MIPPTTAQQRGLAYSQMPSAIISLLSSIYVIHHILCSQPQKRQRLYHRLVLALNVAVIPLSLAYLLGPFAIPEGTPYSPAASGTQQSCTFVGFLAIMYVLVVPFYYASLSLQAYLAIKHNFREQKYKWVEKWIHVVAYTIPLALASTAAATENINPGGSGCTYSKAPRGCEGNPDVECTRGEDIDIVVYIFVFGQIALYFILPPIGAVAMYRVINKLQKEIEKSRGMQRIRASAKKQMWNCFAWQMGLYLLSFWGTFVLVLVHFVHRTISGTNNYNLNILANCIISLQGFVMAMVYFTLDRMGQRKRKRLAEGSLPENATSARSQTRRELTVDEIRSNARTKSEAESSATDGEEDYTFNIFDGTPSPDSPWAKYIDQDSDSSADDADAPNGSGNTHSHNM
ncbi:hypothetical protein ACHAXT_011345 [Thalassiosira profunda]